MLLFKVEKHGFYLHEASSLVDHCCCRPVCLRGGENIFWRPIGVMLSKTCMRAGDHAECGMGNWNSLKVWQYFWDQDDPQACLSASSRGSAGCLGGSSLSYSRFTERTRSSAVKTQEPLGGESSQFPPSLYAAFPSCFLVSLFLCSSLSHFYFLLLLFFSCRIIKFTL